MCNRVWAWQECGVRPPKRRGRPQRVKLSPEELQRQVNEALERGRQYHEEYLGRMRRRYGTPLPSWVPLR